MQKYPLQWPAGWPRTKHPVTSRFGRYNNKPSVYTSSNNVMEELHRLGGKDIIISTNLELRNDGMPRSSQRSPEDQGIAVYFKWKNETMVIACDTFKNIGCNLYAVSKTIEAMRGIERWGCSELLNRAFTGFKALPQEATAINAWWDILGVQQNASKEEIIKTFRQKSKIYHPDIPITGDEIKFRELKTAYEMAIN